MSTSPSWVGSATISAIVALENARTAPTGTESSTKAVYFDAHLFLSDSGKNTAPTQILALLRYFNQPDFDFNPDDVHICFVVANVAKMNAKASNLRSADVDPGSYAIIGDIVQLIPAGDNVDPQHPVMLHASGLVTDIDNKTNSFKMSPTQYVHALRDLQNPKPSIPLGCDLDALSNRWKSRKPPIPAKSSYIALTGYLCGLKKTDSGIVEFSVEVEKVTFLGKSFTSIASASPSPATPAKRAGLKFSFDTPTPATKRPQSKVPTTASQAIASSSQTMANDDELEYVDPAQATSPPN